MNDLIGITGGIGAGKSVVSRILRLKGFEVYDCDSEASFLMEHLSDIREKLCQKFGQKCYDSQGKLNRTYLASRIFKSPSELQWMNSLVHEAVRCDIRKHLSKDGPFFVESAIIGTSGLDEMCSQIWLVTAKETTRLQRAINRGGVRGDIERRMEIQKSEFNSLPQEKIRIIQNDDNSEILPQIEVFLESLCM